jgi:hypothetical protein
MVKNGNKMVEMVKNGRNGNKMVKNIIIRGKIVC